MHMQCTVSHKEWNEISLAARSMKLTVPLNDGQRGGRNILRRTWIYNYVLLYLVSLPHYFTQHEPRPIYSTCWTFLMMSDLQARYKVNQPLGFCYATCLHLLYTITGWTYEGSDCRRYILVAPEGPPNRIMTKRNWTLGRSPCAKLEVFFVQSTFIIPKLLVCEHATSTESSYYTKLNSEKILLRSSCSLKIEETRKSSWPQDFG